MPGHCSIAERKCSCDAFDRAEEYEPARRDDGVISSSTHIVQSCGWETAAHNWSETRSDLRDKKLVMNLVRLHLQILHVPRKR